MGFDPGFVTDPGVTRRVPCFQFTAQPVELVPDLTPRHGDLRGNFRRRDLFPVEMITPPVRFIPNAFKVAGDGVQGIAGIPETIKLRVVPVAFCFAAQDFLREQSFAPEGHDPFGVQILGMKAPQAHDGLLRGRVARFHLRFDAFQVGAG